MRIRQFVTCRQMSSKILNIYISYNHVLFVTTKCIYHQTVNSVKVFFIIWFQSVMELSDIHCVYEGDLVEVDQNTYVPRQKMHAFLLHDSMVMASYIPNRYLVG